MTLSAIATTLVFLLVRSALRLKIDQRGSGKTDIIEEETFTIDTIGVYLVPGFSGLMLSCSMDQGNLKALTTITSGLYILSGFGVIAFFLLKEDQIIMKKLRKAKIMKWVSVAIAIMSFSVFALSVMRYFID